MRRHSPRTVFTLSPFQAFESINGIEDVMCFITDVGTNGEATLTVTIVEYSRDEFNYQNNLFYHDGNPRLDLFACST